MINQEQLQRSPGIAQQGNLDTLQGYDTARLELWSRRLRPGCETSGKSRHGAAPPPSPLRDLVGAHTGRLRPVGKPLDDRVVSPASSFGKRDAVHAD